MAAKYKKHAKAEEEKLYNALQEIEEGTGDYGLVQSQWEHYAKFLDQSDQNKKENFWKGVGILGGIIVTILTPFALEGARKVATSPDTVDLAKKFYGDKTQKPKL